MTPGARFHGDTITDRLWTAPALREEDMAGAEISTCFCVVLTSRECGP